MSAKRVEAAARVIHAEMQQGKQTAGSFAAALESAQLLMSPEVAAELAAFRKERELAEAVALMGALPMPIGPEPRTLDVVEEELTGVNLSLWEEEQTTARLRLEVAGRKAYGDRLKAENAGLTAELHEARKYIRAVEQLLAKRTPFSPRGQEAVLLAIQWLLEDRNEYRSRVDGAEKEARLTRARIAALLVEPTDPQACALCSVPEDGHGVRVDAGGFGVEHEWTRPTDALVRERERMRRELERRAAGELPELALPWAHAMSDDDLRGFLDDLVSAALNRWRSEPDVPDRVTLAEIEKACAGWRTPGQGFRSDEPERPAADTLGAWLHWRFGPHGQRWDALTEDDQAYWEHQARAVRRAVARGGFKAAPSVEESADALTRRLVPVQALREDEPAEAPALTVFRASHDSIVMGLYTSREAAMDHVHAVLANEEGGDVTARVIWRADDPEADEPVWECWLFDSDMADDKPTGYVVTPVEVASEYDAEADE